MRNKRLDVLRCIAVVIVIAHHANLYHVATKTGWVGVDLFFVLSGFLISGLLYSEYKTHRAIDIKRFFIRRGLKIYPAFWVMLLATMVAQLLFWKHSVPLRPYLYELFFIQNYHFGIWTHTWSLAVEEHFYIVLPLLLLILIRSSSSQTDPFGSIPRIFVGVASACLIIRIATISIIPPAIFRTPWVMNPTQCRIDGLFFGVFLGYLYHFRPGTIAALFQSRRNHILLAILTAALLSCCFIYTRDDRFLLTYGLTFLYLGFGLLLMLTMYVRDVLSGPAAAAAARIGELCAYIGMYSYSIYLWHFMFIEAVQIFLRKHILHTAFEVPRSVLLAIYLIGSITLGVVLARLVEFPVLRIRDRIFPAIQRRPPVSPDPTTVSAVERPVSV
jgi:peptidoglycan/LPS O-acetylase OafA/YrhL